jgi:hypothetical protein
MLRTETIERLQEFIKRAEYIRTFSYLEEQDRIAGFEIKKVGDKFQVDFYQPSDEKRDALLFNIRLFIQDKDDISLRRLTDLYNDPGISDQWKKELEHYRKELNDRLEWIATEGPKGKISHRDVLNMFLYGKFGHHDQDDRAYKLYKKWITDENEYEIMHNTFHTILVWILAVIINISVVSKKELQRHNIKNIAP